MKIGIFGGAFNPPHIGHTAAAARAIGEKSLDLVIVIPTGTSPHKNMPLFTPSPDIRLQMTKNAFCDIENTIVSDMEIYSAENNYTIDTVTQIQKEYPDAKLYLLVGNDMYDSLDTWKQSDKLLSAAEPVLLRRDIVDISSTTLRGLLPEREGDQYICGANYKLIIQHRLYNAKPNWKWLRDEAYSMLDPGRILHVKETEKAAAELAKRWNASVDDAREAAILHDITKRLDFNENLCIIAEHRIITNSYTNSYNINEAKILHPLTAALLAKSMFGVSDEVAEAIKLHTTGSPGMTLLDKIIYVADYIELTRDYENVEQMRRLAYEDINKAMIMGLNMVISDLADKGITPNKSTYEALEDLMGVSKRKVTT
ncbi:MAG: bis(5'-nucleosyl)-tetraphosphatase (symmetrical) YqeK [Oscillospiraceae bacterium]|nr:bis(5'-nucleosyl)-tetraphosphatase (symmetrical) YqeK [Oscillospiraceae bacterium]